MSVLLKSGEGPVRNVCPGRGAGPASQKDRWCGVFVLAAALALSGCAKSTDFNATLCTGAPTEADSGACEAPKARVNLTLPRADLLNRAQVEAAETTGSVPPSGALAQSTVPPAGPAPDVATPATAEAAPAAQPAADAEPKTRETKAPETKAPEAKAPEAKPAEAPARAENPPADQGRDARIEAASRTAAGADDGPATGRRVRGLLREAGLPAGQNMTLTEAVRRAISDHPLIGLAGARIDEATATIGVSQSALYPQLEGRAGGGHGVTGTYQKSDTLSYFSNDNASGAVRAEASLAGRQLLFDFGAVRADIDRASSLHRSEQFKLQEQTDDVVNKVTDIYLRIIEQRDLMAAATENVAALEKLSRLVEDNERNGNGTLADSKRVRSRLVDGQTGLADAKSELQTGADRFRRLVRAYPGALKPAPSLIALIPKTPDGAIAEASRNNPRIKALEQALAAARHEVESQRKSALPKLHFETDIGTKDFRSRADKTELDARGMVVLKYKFLDGGLQSRQLDQTNARVLQTELRLRNDLDEAEADIRKYYRILSAARGKAESLKENVETAKKARELYDEQFRGGKRTLLELLDIQTAYYTARRTLIANRFEEQRSVNAVLLSMGKLTQAMVSGRTR